MALNCRIVKISYRARRDHFMETGERLPRKVLVVDPAAPPRQLVLDDFFDA